MVLLQGETVGNKWQLFRKLKRGLPHDSASSLRGIYMKESKSGFWRNVSIPVFTAVLPTTTKMWKQTIGHMEKGGDVYTNMEYYSALKRGELCNMRQRRWTLTGKDMATDSSVLAWRIPGTGEPGGLPPTGSHRVRRDWSDLAAAAAADEPWRHCAQWNKASQKDKYYMWGH